MPRRKWLNPTIGSKPKVPKTFLSHHLVKIANNKHTALIPKLVCAIRICPIEMAWMYVYACVSSTNSVYLEMLTSKFIASGR